MEGPIAEASMGAPNLLLKARKGDSNFTAEETAPGEARDLKGVAWWVLHKGIEAIVDFSSVEML